jgi:hypothetical protein
VTNREEEPVGRLAGPAKLGVLVRLLGAGIIVVSLFSLVDAIAELVNTPYYRFADAGVGFWLGIAISLVLNAALIWAGFSIISRHPSRRRAITIIFAIATLFEIYNLVKGLILAWNYQYFRASWVALPLFWLILWGGTLAYLIATRRDPEFQPRLGASPIETAPPETHRVVAAKIADGPGWHEALLASLDETGVQETQRRRAWPWVLALIALLALSRLLDPVVSPAIDSLDPDWRSLAWMIFGFVSIVAIGLPVAAIRRRMLQARQRSAEAALKKSGAKRPIFYLRSFGLDQEVGRPSVLELLFNVQPANPEQSMTRVVGRCGPVIAIGRPGERLPALGAARFYVAHELWQEKVADVATVAQLVIWASGTTQGLQWEITHLVRSLSPEKLVLWAHPHLLDLDADEREAQWSCFVDGLGGLFPKPLPKPLGATRFFAFDKDFTPIPFASKRWTHQSAMMASLRALLRAKDIPPYDKKRTARRRMIWRVVLGTLGAVFAVALLGASYVFWNYVRPAAPSPLAWNLLGSDLIDDEAFVTPPSSDEVIGRLRGTVGELDGHWFGANWQDVPPGQLPPLKLAAQHYLAAFEAAHADTAIDALF